MPVNRPKTESSAVLALHVGSLSTQPCYFNYHKAPHSKVVLALNQLVRELVTALAHQLSTDKNSFNTFLYQAHVSSMLCPLYIYMFKYQTAKHIIIYCHNFASSRQAFRDNH